MEQLILGLVGSSASAPVALLAIAGVLAADGRPAFYGFPVGFLGSDNEVVGLRRVPKIRTLRRGIDAVEEDPFRATAFQGSHFRKPEANDPRAHSKWGVFLRRSSVDEIPQFWTTLTGSLAGISPRAYSFLELEGLRRLFRRHEVCGNVFPDGFPLDYRQVISRVRPKPGLISLYTAIKRKDLTVTERLYLDWLYLTGANPVGDIRIVIATFATALKGVGGR